MIAVRATDDWEDIVVPTDKVYFIEGDYYETVERELVINDGVALVNLGDYVAIIGSTCGENAFMYRIKKSEFFRKILEELDVAGGGGKNAQTKI